MPDGSVKFEIQVSQIKSLLQELQKFLGQKAGPICFEPGKGKITLTQTSPIADAQITVRVSGCQETDAFFVDGDWIAQTVKPIAQSTMVVFEVLRSQLVLSWTRGNVKAKVSTNFIEYDDFDPFKEEKDAAELPGKALQLARNNTQIFSLHSFFTERPAAAVIGMSIDKSPFLLVNDQYHGIYIAKKFLPAKKIFLATDSKAVASVAFDPKNVEGNLPVRASVAEGQMFLFFSNIKYVLPTLDPSAVPVKSEIEQIARMFRDGEKTAAFTVKIDDFREAVSVSARPAGGDLTEQFSIRRSGKSEIECLFSSSSSDSSVSLSSNIRKWSKELFLNANVLVDILHRIYACLTKDQLKAVDIFECYVINNSQLFVLYKSDVVYHGFMQIGQEG